MSSPNGETGTMFQKMADLSDFPKYLPPEVAEGYAEEIEERQSVILRLLSSDPAPPHSSELAFGLRCLKNLEEQKIPTKIEFKIKVCAALWKLLVEVAKADAPLYGYANCSKILDNLRCWLCHLNLDHIQPFWRAEPNETEADQVASLFDVLDVKVPLHMIVEEVRKSPRTDCSINNSKRRSYVHHLASLCTTFSYLQGSISVAQGEELMAELASRIDGFYVYSLFYAKMLAVLTPRACTPQLILDGRLWSWWSRVPEGLLPKYDLMWFMPLSRFVELQWANQLEAGHAECSAALRKQLPWLMNKICRTLCLPFGSPAAKAVDGKGQSFPELDRYQIPDEIDAVFMGNQSAWKDVAFFLIYMLEPKPTQPKEEVWTILTLLQRRMRPFLTPATCQGDWLWHCVTLLHSLISLYYRRICRERLLECTALPETRLTAEADQTFVELMLPLVRDLMMLRGAYEMATSMENIARLTQISAMHSSAPVVFSDSPADPFRMDFHSMVMQSTELLNDPTQSGRHVALLRVFSSVVPALSLQMPSVIGELLPLMLQGIDATDSPKTLSALRLLLCVLINVPCLDSNDWQGSELPQPQEPHPALRWPLPRECQLKVGDPDYGATGIVSSMLPSFAIDLVERACDYVSRIPKARAVKNGKISLELATMGLLHGALAIAASQTDRETYKQMVEVLCQFLGSHLLPDQVKPAGMVAFAISRACPEVALPMMLPLMFKKLLPRGSSVPLHEAGVSESEAKWWLSLLSATVRCGGASLLAHRQPLETIMRCAFLDEREVVTKLGMKLFRRVLYSLTSTYIGNDYRLCGGTMWQTLMSSRLGSAVPPEAARTLLWSGAPPPWWITDATPSADWHVPSEDEVAWARDLCFGVLGQVGKMISTVLQVPIPALDTGNSGSPWLEGLATSLPAKKKAAHGAVLGIRLASQVLRGTCDLWPDERGQEELKSRQLPPNLKVAGNTAEVMFNWLSAVLLSSFQVLAAQEQYGIVAETSGKLDQIDVSRVMRKLLKCVAELVGALGDTHPSSLRLFPSLRHVEKHAQGLALQSTSLEMLHPHSRWRDLPRVWWVERVADTMENRIHERRGGHRYAGRRKKLIEELTRQIFSSGFAAVRSRAMGTVAMAVAYHQGCRWPLVQDVLLPALSTESDAALRCGSLSGDAADREQQRLNDSLSGLAAAFAGGIQGLVWGVWRRGMDDASTLGYSLCEAIYAATRVNQGGAYPTDSAQRCEVKPTTVAKLIGAMKHWLDCREVQSWGTTRPRSRAPGLEDEFQEDSNSSKVAPGLAAVRTVSKALAICDRSDCHWRAQIMATTMCLALLNALGPSGIPPRLSSEEQAEVQEVWSKWARWLIRCIEPKGQPGLHALAVHGLLLVLKRSPLKDSLSGLGLSDSSFFQNLLEVMPPLHHEDLMVTADDQVGQKSEPTREPVHAMTSSVFDVWPRIWLRRSSRSFALRNALFWQTYVSFLKSQMDKEGLVDMLRKGAEKLASQPVAEAEFHAAFAEFAAGSLRAVRKPADSQTRQSLWNQLHPWLLSELQQSSEERLGDWCDAVRFVVTGCRRPKLEPMFSDSQAGSEDLQYLIPLFNFVVGGDGDLEFNTLSCALAPIRFDYSKSASDSEKEASSFDAFKRLRLLLSLLIEPLATKVMAASEEFCRKLVAVLEDGLGHPYKQLREEVARGLYFIVQAASHQHKDVSEGALQTVSASLGTWFASEARRLTLLLRADNAAHTNATADDGARPKHVVESSGLLYLLLHSSLSRMSADYLRNAASDWLGFVAAAAAHSDLELRAIAPHAMSLCCCSHPLPPSLEQPTLWSSLPMVKALRPLISEQALEKELEKAFAAGLKQSVLANFFILLTGEAREIYEELRSAAERALGVSKPEIRSAARSAVASFLAVQCESEIVSRLKALKALAGPARDSQAKPVEPFCIAVSTMACMLLTAADCGVPRWSGQAVQAVAPYGKVGVHEIARKEVQSAIQAFLKLQQSSQTSWTECQLKLTPTQLELLNDNKGKLSYFS
ncbi:unnamed protein product [Effrenium voratum]|uniref:Proteasome activator Blm10 middle HEAT repeats region domain-containing protein n=1 Tax=Effrenium voratum TaxID=2562239 RepID=A0AA36HK26_9DINO|nr:unnamed protein product [Effrenium voratum]CAJ1416401.1 unnamed protein product [Effrenium voratum]